MCCGCCPRPPSGAVCLEGQLHRNIRQHGPGTPVVPPSGRRTCGWQGWGSFLHASGRSAGTCRHAECIHSQPPQLMIPADTAHDTVEALGEVGLLQFKDLNTDKSAFQRTYANQVRSLRSEHGRVQPIGRRQHADAGHQAPALACPPRIVVSTPTAFLCPPWLCRIIGVTRACRQLVPSPVRRTLRACTYARRSSGVMRWLASCVISRSM